MHKLLLTISFFSSLFYIRAQEPYDLKLWYNKPAQNWNEALPIGNGHTGAMVFGGTDIEHLQLNNNTLYSGEPSGVYKGTNIISTYDEVVKLLKEGKNVEAEEIVRKNWEGRLSSIYQPLGDLFMEFKQTGEISNYRRELDISRAIQHTTFKQNGVSYRREVFASNPTGAIIIRLTADQPKLDFTATLKSVHPTAKQEFAGKNTVRLNGQAPGYAEQRTFEQIESWGDQYKHPELYDRQGNKKFDKRVLYGEEVGGLGTFFEACLNGQINRRKYSNRERRYSYKRGN